MNPIFYIDFYKVDHVSQYPSDVTQVWSNFTPRSSHVPGTRKVVFFGLQYFMLEYLQKQFNEGFFQQPLESVLNEYRTVIRETLGVQNPKTDHIEALHKRGYLPLAIYALPEGTSVDLGIPMLVITNTLPEFFWLPNYLESILSAILWKPCTSATTAQRFRKLFERHALAAGETDLSFVDWQGHDFSFRGMSGLEDAVLSGMGHLTSFSGTDTIPAILAAQEYYYAKLSVGGSVPATEHSVMCAGGKDGELETFRRLIEDVYPSGIVSIVSDTWDLWKVLTEYVPALKAKILARDGKLVIRPDSGDPVKIVCGYSDLFSLVDPAGIKPKASPERLGAMRLLAEALGTTAQAGALPLINKGGIIYGDGISVERADAILGSIRNDLRLSPYNMVFGIGSYTYEYVTRDTYGFAMKATAVRRNGEVEAIFKKPVTDDGSKTSHVGIPVVYRTQESTDMKPEYFVVQTTDPGKLDNSAFNLVYSDGKIVQSESFDAIRARVRY